MKGVAPSRLTFGVSCHQNGASSIPDCWHPARLLSGLDPLLGSGRTASESNRLIASLHDVTVVREAIECAHTGRLPLGLAPRPDKVGHRRLAAHVALALNPSTERFGRVPLMLGAPPVKRGRTHAKLTANVRNLDSGIGSLEHLHDLAVTETGLRHVEPLTLEKILLLTTPI